MVRSVKERFDEKVDKSGACWLWTASRYPDGYGMFGVSKGVIRRAHRVAFELYVGPIPDGIFVCHRCDTPLCVNPEHLFLGTAKDNLTDCRDKGRYRQRGSPGESNGRATITEVTARAIKAALSIEPRTAAIAEQFNVSQAVVYDIKVGRKWKHLEQFQRVERPLHFFTNRRAYMSKSGTRRIYRVVDSNGDKAVEYLVDAATPAQALKAVTEPRYDVEVASGHEIARLVGEGVKVQKAGAVE